VLSTGEQRARGVSCRTDEAKGSSVCGLQRELERLEAHVEAHDLQPERRLG
jgi:hypothetical protein